MSKVFVLENGVEFPELRKLYQFSNNHPYLLKNKLFNIVGISIEENKIVLKCLGEKNTITLKFSYFIEGYGNAYHEVERWEIDAEPDDYIINLQDMSSIYRVLKTSQYGQAFYCDDKDSYLSQGDYFVLKGYKDCEYVKNKKEYEEFMERDEERFREECIRKFRKVWRYMGETGLKEKRCVSKEEAIKALYPEDHNKLCEYGMCYLCMYAKNSFLDRYKCKLCPINWKYKNSQNYCMSYGSLYIEWHNAMRNKAYYTSSTLAIEISDLPLKENKKKTSNSLWNGRILCVSNGASPDYYSPGKIYYIVDGQFTDDLQNESYWVSFKDFCRGNPGKWVLIDSDGSYKESDRDIAIRKFRAMWNYMGIISIVDNRCVSKKETIEALYPEDINEMANYSFCYLCLYKEILFDKTAIWWGCSNCPIDWNGEYCIINNWYKDYIKSYKAKDVNTYSRCCFKISDLPEKK